MLAREVFHLRRRKKTLMRIKKIKFNLGINGPKEVAVEVVLVVEAEVEEEVVEEEEVTARLPAPNLILPILASTIIRRPGLS
jgi:hypothetical protein